MPLVGAVLADIGRYLILCVVTLGFGYVMGFRVETNVARRPLAARRYVDRLRAVLLLDLGVRRHEGPDPGAVQGIMFLIVLPLSLRQQHLRPADTMPGWLQTFVKVNPISQLVDTVRGLMIGGPVAEALIWTLVWMAVLLVVFVPLALRGTASAPDCSITLTHTPTESGRSTQAGHAGQQCWTSRDGLSVVAARSSASPTA